MRELQLALVQVPQQVRVQVPPALASPRQCWPQAQTPDVFPCGSQGSARSPEPIPTQAAQQVPQRAAVPEPVSVPVPEPVPSRVSLEVVASSANGSVPALSALRHFGPPQPAPQTELSPILPAQKMSWPSS